MRFAPTTRLFTSTSAKMTQYNITITSDIVCPWCYIGHTRLSKAIATHKQSHPTDTFHLSYKPFYLNPAAQVQQHNHTGPAPPPFPIPSIPRREAYAAKFGPQRAAQLETMMRATAAGEGLEFKFGGMTGPSRNGHRLVRFAQNHGGEDAQNATMLGLWRRYFEQEVDITTLETLVEVGVEAGLGTAEEVKGFLEKGEGAEDVDREAEEAREKGVSGVPFYEIQGVWEISGAQEPRAFERLFGRWKELEARGEAPVVEGKGGDACL
jgi:predicted DsbA family dithiol-disulfide isomerase